MYKPQLSLCPCNSTAPPFLLHWTFKNNGSEGAPGTFVAGNGLCVTYDVPTTNLVMDVCNADPAVAPLQEFSIQSEGTILSPSRGLCWDSQYYGNASGSVLGLYNCFPDQEWELFTFDSGTGLITNTQVSTLCVNGGTPPPPLPTPQQLAWTRYEVSLMISYDMVTQLTEEPNPQHFCIDAGGDSGFPVPPPSRFDPSALNTSQWMDAARAVGAGYTLLVASHCSGFLQWQSNVTLPDGTPYPYTVRQSAWQGGQGDIVDDYVQSSKAAGLPFGFYLTWNYNYLFNRGPNGFAKTPLQAGQVNVSEAEYYAIQLATIEEVWGRYPGAISEIWFDGGEDNKAMNDLIVELQPHAIATCGTQPPNLARLVGKESGYAGYPVWSTAAGPNSNGDPMGRMFVPAEADTPIAAADAWFWKPEQKYRSAATLRSVYLNTVGANSLLELGVLPDNTGNIPADQLAVLQDLGDYIRRCHSPAAAVASTAANGTLAALSIRLDFPTTIIDRVILQEDQAFGQLVQAFTVSVLPEGGYDPAPVDVAVGTAIGNKRILFFASGPIPASAVIVTATALYPGMPTAYWRNVAAYAPCD